MPGLFCCLASRHNITSELRIRGRRKSVLREFGCPKAVTSGVVPHVRDMMRDDSSRPKVFKEPAVSAI